MLFILLLAAVGIILAGWAVLRQEKFGRLPAGARLERIQSSPNYQDGEFRNTVPTIMLAEGQSSIKIMGDFLFGTRTRLKPDEPLPTVRLELDALDPAKDMLIWLGHSSYFIQLGGKRILVDPVFNDHGAPLAVFNKNFPGTDLYRAADMPPLDFLLISHDHWDHLDYSTAVGLREKVKTVITPLGVGAHFEYWGYPKEKLKEADWNTALRFENELLIHIVPARHFSGRLLTRNKTGWAGFVLETPTLRLFLSGDSGYGPHLAEIARTFGRFDLVAIDGGQYDARWPQMHMTPEEAALAAKELKAEAFLLSHVGRFCISSHQWDDPFRRVVEAAKDKPFRLLTPKIGEPVWLDGTEQSFTRWWEGLK
jgi:L-ascorbate metabolism protein UlaG (beta-lactamase superfamily)